MSRIGKDTPAATGMGAGGCLVRLGWMLLGNVVLLLCLVAIYQGQGALSYADAIFWGVAAACILLRYLDIRYLHGLTAAGVPATVSNWYRYVIVFLIVVALAWGVVHAVSSHLA
jgi:hypothetical protein